jgi:ribosomal protein S18 acetylase RimI-like enzyme
MADDHYTTLLKAPEQTSGSLLLSEFYSKTLSPVSLLGLIPAWYVLIWNKSFDAKLLFDEPRGHLYGLMIIFTFVMGLRLIQSVLLALRDYRALEAGLKDFLIFLAVVAFTTGAFFKLFAFGDARHISLIYFGLTMVGVFNFYSLYRTRLLERSDYIDYVVERQIQFINVVTFVLVALSMACVWIVATWFPNSLTVAEGAVVLTFPVLILNMVHSAQLTFMPKFLLSNAYDAQDAVIKRFRKLFRGASSALTDEKLREYLLGAEYSKFQELSLARATQDQVPQIVDLLADELDYVYKYIFASADVWAIKKVLNRMLRMYGGFGSMGYNHFYVITDSKGNAAGFLLMDSRRKASVYSWFEWMVLVPVVGRNFGWLSLPKIYRNSRVVIRLQPQITSHDQVCLANLLIRRDYRRQGYGSSVVRLLVNALTEKANRVSARCILALVRRHNCASLALFEGQGFKKINQKSFIFHDDPFRHDSGIGEAVYLKYDLTQ